MTRNMGKLDRVLRILVGLVLLAHVYIVPTSWGWLGLIPIVTALAGFCPIYRALGLNTCAAAQTS
jgi:hypothetical protein